MAIKGKGRTRSRPVSRAPRREPVTVKPPLFLRRWVQVGAAFVAGVLVVTLVVWVTNGLRRDRALSRSNAQASQQRKAGQTWQTELEGQIGKLGQITPGTPTAPTIFTSVADAIGALAKGKTPPKGSAAALETVRTDAKAASDALTKYGLSDAIRGKGFDVGEVNYFLDSQKLIARSLDLYRQAAALAEIALDAKGRDALAKQATTAKANADALFQEGWFDYQQALYAAGIVQTPLGGAGGLSGGS